MDKIMIIDDEESILKSLQRSLRSREDWDVEVYADPQQALRRLQTNIFDVVISDCNMPGISGLDLFQELKELQPDAVRILLTGMVNVETVIAAVNKAGAFRFISKPWEDEELLNSIEEGIAQRRMIVENRILAQRVRDQQRELESLKNSFSVQS
jgi:DNA-binding NtrC family response regulator